MGLEDSTPSEMSYRERQIPCDSTCVWYLKNKTNEQIKQKQSHRYRGQTGGFQKKGGGGLGKRGEGMKRHGLPVIKCHGDVIHSIRTIVNNIVIISCGDR